MAFIHEAFAIESFPVLPLSKGELEGVYNATLKGLREPPLTPPWKGGEFRKCLIHSISQQKWGDRSIFACCAVVLILSVLFTPGAYALDNPGGTPVNLEIRDKRLMNNGEPFVPLGFVVFGVEDQDMETMKEMGCTSVHFEFSFLNFFPDNLNDSPPGPEEHPLSVLDMAHRHNLVAFPMMTAHYITPWIAKKCEGELFVNQKGESVGGGWFRFNMRGPNFREVLTEFWKRSVDLTGDHPALGCYVSWNEPYYGSAIHHDFDKANILDYSEPRLRDYREWLKTKFSAIAQFNEYMDTEFEDFDHVKPPVHPDDNRPHWFYWMDFGYQSFADFFNWQRSVILQERRNVLLTHKHPMSALSSGNAATANKFSLHRKSQDIFGCDVYNGSIFHYRDVFEAARSLGARGGPVLTFETGMQGWSGLSPKEPGHAPLQLLAQFAGGARGMFLFCWGENKGHGFNNDEVISPEIRKELVDLYKFIGANQEGFSSPRDPSRIGVLLSHISHIHYPVGGEYAMRLQQTFDLLRNQHFAVDFIDETMIDEGLLNQYSLIVAPSMTILDQERLDSIGRYIDSGGKLIAFAGAFERNEKFEKIHAPEWLGVENRRKGIWSRGACLLTGCVQPLRPYLSSELWVMNHESVDTTLPADAIAGQVPEKEMKQRILVGNYDAYGSVLLSMNERVAYCAFDSLYSERLGALIGGIAEEIFGVEREISVRFNDREDTEVITSLSGDGEYLLVLNASTLAKQLTIEYPEPVEGKIRSLRNGEVYQLNKGRFDISFAEYDYDLFRVEKESMNAK